MVGYVPNFEINGGYAQMLRDGVREKVELATKFGALFADSKPEVHGNPRYMKAACKGNLKWLDINCIYLYYQHQVDTPVPIDVTIFTLA